MQNMMDIKEILLHWFDKFFDKKLLVAVLKMRILKKKQLSEELHKPIIRKFKQRKVQSPFVNNIWDADLADVQLISKFN